MHWPTHVYKSGRLLTSHEVSRFIPSTPSLIVHANNQDTPCSTLRKLVCKSGNRRVVLAAAVHPLWSDDEGYRDGRPVWILRLYSLVLLCAKDSLPRCNQSPSGACIPARMHALECISPPQIAALHLLRSICSARRTRGGCGGGERFAACALSKCVAFREAQTSSESV